MVLELRARPSEYLKACHPTSNRGTRALPPLLPKVSSYQANLPRLKTTGDSAIIAPPLIADKSHVDVIADILRKALATL